MNILMNSINAIKGNGKISIETKMDNKQIHIKFSDTGKGIPADKIEGLFDPGFTSKNSNIRMRTGLFTSYNIIQKHKGDIKVKSETGKGTTFTITIPANLEKMLQE